MKKNILSKINSTRVFKRKLPRKFRRVPNVSEVDARKYFDEEFYLTSNPDVLASGADAFSHFVSHGWKEGRNPSRSFNLMEYVVANPDFIKTNENPFFHFVQHNQAPEEFLTTFGDRASVEAVFDEEYYRASNPDLAFADQNLFDHFVEFGWKENRNPAEGIDLAGYLKQRRENPSQRNAPFPQYLEEMNSNVCFTDLFGAIDDFRKSFDARYYLIENVDVSNSGVDPFEHFLIHGWRECRRPYAGFDLNFYDRAFAKNQLSNFSAHSNAKVAAENRDPSLMAGARQFFDETYYLEKNPDVAKSGMCPFRHFMSFGWAELRNPSPAFDLVWYTQYYLRSDWSINPLEHYCVTGRGLGFRTSPPTEVAFSSPYSYSRHKKNIKRVCLFAAYDPDGIIDDVVVEYIAALSKYADVYFLSDCHVSPAELVKIDAYTKGAWGHRHGLYDFGSWSELAQDKVGWDKIDTYDELMLVNDSSFLLGDLGPVFTEMDSKACAWWGLQATKGLVSTIKMPGQALKDKIDIDVIKSDFLSCFESDEFYDFHIGSYFVVYRKPVKLEQKFKDLLNNVREEKAKINLIRKYEIGITRFLISLGHEFETFERHVYPFQPLYTEESFQLVGRGFPLLKKYHLIENQYGLTELFNWKSRLVDAGVTKDLAPYAENLRRTGNAEKIYHNQDIDRLALNPTLSPTALITKDSETPKYKDWWVFPVCAHSHQLNDNVRALFEYVKNNPRIKKIVLTRSRSIDVDGLNLHVLPLNSAEGQFYLLRSKNIFLKHSVAANIGVNLSKSMHAFHNLWHGIPLKRIGYCSIDLQDRLSWLEAENRMFTSVISASKIDQLAMTAAYWPLTVNDIWLTGLPRHDLITMPNSDLPKDMRLEVEKVRVALAGRKLIIFAPTFRLNQDEGYYSFSQKEVAALKRLLMKKGYVLGIREHMADRSRQYSSQLKGECFIDLSASIYPNVEVLMKEAIALVTDYSSIFIDFLVTGKPVISFAYDYEHYLSEERGLFYDLDWCFPGIIAKSTKELFAALSSIEDVLSDRQRESYDHRRKMFIENIDGNNSKRLHDEIIALKQKDISIFDIKKVVGPGNVLFDVVFVYERGHEITARYRIFNLAPEFRAMGLKCRIVCSDELSLNLVKSCSILIFSRVECSERLLDMVHAHKLSGKKFVFDIDDLMFDESLLNEAEYYRLRPKMQGKIRNTSRGYKRLMREADMVTVTTSSLASYAKNKGHNALKVPNSLSTALISRYSNLKNKDNENTGSKIKVCYLSGTKTHGEDFKLIHDAVKMVSAQFLDVEFHVVGGVIYDELENAELLRGWKVHEKMSYEQMHQFISEMDINLCPLVKNKFNDSKSELKFFEAALHGVPTIASPSETYEESIISGHNGFIARNENEWVQYLTELILDRGLRVSNGERARESALVKFSASSIAENLVGSLNALSKNNFL